MPDALVKRRVEKLTDPDTVRLVVETLVEETFETASEVPVAFTKLKLEEEALVTVRFPVPVAFVNVTP